MGQAGFDARSFPPGMAVHQCPTLCAMTLSLSNENENRQISERDDLGPPVVSGARGSGDRFGIPKPSPQGGRTSHGARRLQGEGR